MREIFNTCNCHHVTMQSLLHHETESSQFNNDSRGITASTNKMLYKEVNLNGLAGLQIDEGCNSRPGEITSDRSLPGGLT